MVAFWPSRRAVQDEFTSFYSSRAPMLRNTAYLLCGDWHLAEDLTQTVFIKLYRAWRRIERHDTMDQFARKVLLRTYLDERRRPWRREFPTEPDAEDLEVADFGDDTEGRLAIRQAVLQLSRQHRAVLVLRYWEDMPVEQVAEILECSPGTVKSQTSRGLASLRKLLGGGADGADETGLFPHAGRSASAPAARQR
ncbi:RNA polymerase sigma24 factor [Rhizocola hellebori]|uniref:RNA polymerase sigma24 factor n=1 Tax=Rhizocola hellebori TaxID=1392758 RepID=A0A8J3QCK2_9ACTN|nr:SigE family RNA polymerase sigma factor [Rhizocola hellebori]GIH06966.1 RNA polymerase sigma24 factor [Rhizocola hellebori]